MFTADISVVIPTFNRSALLRQALESLLGQDTAGGRVEIIVVDNNSTDDTRDVVASLAGSDGTRIVYLKEDRQGNSFAKNTGIQRASAPIVAASALTTLWPPGARSKAKSRHLCASIRVWKHAAYSCTVEHSAMRAVFFRSPAEAPSSQR